MANRFAPAENIVINAPTTVKGAGRELQLAGMQELTNKSSSQHFFLRILKVIIQVSVLGWLKGVGHFSSVGNEFFGSIVRWRL